MKNSILFYIVLVAVVFGGVKWTAHSLLEKKKAELDKSNFHTTITQLLTVSGDPKAALLAGKNIVIYYLVFPEKDYTQFNKFVAEQPKAVVIPLTTQSEKTMDEMMKEETKVKPNLSLTYDAAWFGAVAKPIRHVYGKPDGIGNAFSVHPEVVVINPAGKITMYSGGENKKLFEEIKAALK